MYGNMIFPINECKIVMSLALKRNRYGIFMVLPYNKRIIALILINIVPCRIPMRDNYDFSLIGVVCVLSVIIFGTPRLASIT